MSHVEQIKEKLTIVDVIGAYLKLEKAGANFKALCPFHHEKTASFFISPGRGSYYCFGCGLKGDIFSFVESFEGVDFRGALKILADKSGVKLTPEDPKKRDEKEKLFHCLEEATSFFEENLGKVEFKEALSYLEGRGLKKETIREWRLGYAPEEWHSLELYLKNKKFPTEIIEKSGLIKRTEETGKGVRFYDRFRGRVIFPIKDSSDRVVGFSGRILKDDGKSAKYLNSPETETFNKSRVLFGLDKAKLAIRETEEIVLVEGQMDIVLSHQAGIKNTVALSGTALTEHHTELLHRFSNRIIFALDSDNAGIKATRRSAILSLKEGLEVKVALLPSGLDPADCILKDPTILKEAIKNSIPIIDFSLEKIISSGASGKKLIQEIEENVFPFIFELESKMEKSQHLKHISKRTHIEESAVREDYEKAEHKFNLENTQERSFKEDKAPPAQAPKHLIEKRIYGILKWQESSKTPIIPPKEILEKFQTIVGIEKMKKILEVFEPHKDKLILEAEVLYNTSNTERDLNELLENLEQDYIKKELGEEIEKLTAAERGLQKEKVDEILKKCKALSERLEKLLKKKRA